MAHEIEEIGGKGSFAYADTIGSAWHQLGVPMSGLSNADDILEACRGNYDVFKDPLTVPDPEDYEQVLETDRYFTWRETEDVDEDGEPIEGVMKRQLLGIVGSDYRVIQNKQALNFALEMAGMHESEPNIDCAGVLNDGRRFFATIPLPELVIDPKGVADRYGRNLVVVTGHDGTQALQVVNGFTRAVCANTVAAALNRSKHQITIRHVGDEDLPIAVAKKNLALMLSADEEFEALAYEMLKKPSDWKELKRISEAIWPLKEDASEQAKTLHDNRLGQIKVIWDSERGATGYGKNRYAAFQTLTEYMEHNQHMVGEYTRYNRALRAVDSPGFNHRVRKLAKVLVSGQPVRALKSGV